MLSPDLFLLILGLLMIITPSILAAKEGDDDESIVRFIMKLDLNSIFLIRALTLSGLVFFTIGLILLFV